MASSAEPAPSPPTPWLKTRLRHLYDGNDRSSYVFRWSLLALDIVTIALFIELTFIDEAPWMIALELSLGVLLLAELSARLYISHAPWRRLLRPMTIADIVVIVSMFAAAFVENLGFLRVLRALRLIRSYHVLGMLRRESLWVRRNEDLILSTTNLVVFVFFTTALVFVTQHQINPDIHNYVDALYFTVTTLTTTGFGDITMQGDWGRLMAVLIMILGISLFLRLLQTVFRPPKVHVTCPHCGLSRHDPDAIHCKHCGEVIHIPTRGDA